MDFLDEKGYPGTRQADGSWDGGDTAAIMGTIIATDPALAQTLPLIPFDSYPEPVPLRHPDPLKWYGQPDRFSRDQLIPMICGFIRNRAFNGDCFFEAHKRKLFCLAWNTKGNGAMDLPNKFPDPCGPEIWALWIRWATPWWASYVLWFLDLQTLIGAIQWRYFRDPKNRVTRNHILVCLTARNTMPSVTSTLAFRISNLPVLIGLWRDHCTAVGEYPTADLLAKAFSESKK